MRYDSLFEKAISFLTLLAFVPLVVIPQVYYPSGEGKALAIQIVVLVVSVAFALTWTASQGFREAVSEKFRTYARLSLVRVLGIYALIFFISTAFATDGFLAWHGSLSRSGSGSAFMMLFLTALFLLLLIGFSEKQYSRFWKYSLVVFYILFFHTLLQKLGGEPRPSSLVGNPIFLGSYFSFSILSAIMVAREARSYLRIAALSAIPLGVLGILLTGSRGPLAGIAVGVIVALVYACIKGKSEIFGRFSVRKIAGGSLLALALFTGVFFATRTNQFWQRIPGLDRLANTSLADQNASARLISNKIALHSVNPREHGIKKFLFGWGPENYIHAYYANYDPMLYAEDAANFDRSHNQLLDIFAMTGILGLLAYLGIWILIFRHVFNGAFDAAKLAIAFFGAAYLVQNLFAFDDIVMLVPLIVFWAYCAWNMQKEHEA